MTWKTLARYGAAILISGLALGYLGPLDSANRFGVLERYVFWLASCAAGWLQAMIIAHGIRAILDPAKVPGWALYLLTAIILTFPLTFEIRWMWRALAAGPVVQQPFHVAWVTVFIIDLCFTLLLWLLIERWPLARQSAAAEQSLSGRGRLATDDLQSNDDSALKPPTVDMLRRAPDGFSGPLLAIKTEDHYLRIFTPEEDGLVLYRLSEAVADLQHADGLIVHRSWWVSRTAIKRARRQGRQAELELTNGQRVPVSRSRVDGLIGHGWLKS